MPQKRWIQVRLAIESGILEYFLVGDHGRYWENIKDLATAYAIIAIKYSAGGL